MVFKITKNNAQKSQNGFTIVELMVALAVFSVILLVMTVAIMQVSKLYYKGITEANTQSTARSVIDTVSQAIQFSGGTVLDTPTSPTSGNSYDFCVNNQEFSYRPGYQLTDGTAGVHQTKHALVLRTVAACSGPTGQVMSGGSVVGRELLAPNMRLSNIVVKNLGNNLYKVQVRIAYGDSDLLYSPSNPTSTNGDLATDATCKGQAGRQFCAVSEISTIVISRVK
ncbi:MAG TPA: prepilin-type N-terminal cleavage/methylation domain-containing protein [Patescibacteria group bacterium]|nr:prepilin-type N-terminal cleavage/methylation domain-containing protein [Patescibacteria group bacterium]